MIILVAIISFFCGGFIGFTITCLLVAAGQDDRRVDE